MIFKIVFVVAISIFFNSESVNSICCYPGRHEHCRSYYSEVDFALGTCADCTKGYPYCGSGPVGCNMFGCECKDPCLENSYNEPIPRAKTSSSKSSAITISEKQAFDKINTDHDLFISASEYRIFMQNSNPNVRLAMTKFYLADKDGDRKLSFEEFKNAPFEEIPNKNTTPKN